MTLRALFLKLRAVLRPTRVDAEMSEELQFHIEQETAHRIARGFSPTEARRQALAAFGGLEHTKEAYRDDRGDRWLTDLGTDLQFALRLLRRNPTLTATVALTLSLGIGASVAMFSAVNAVLLRPLPLREPDRLVALWEDNADKGWVQQSAAPANMIDWSERVTSLDGVAAWADFLDFPVMTGRGEPEALRAWNVTGNFFEVTGAPMALGTGFAPDAHWTPSPLQAVLSHSAWQKRFGGDSSIVGRSITLDGKPVQVVGVAGPSLALPSHDTELWIPLRWDRADLQQTWFRRAHFMRPIGRLRDGVTIQAANTELQRVMLSLEQQYPETNIRMRAGLGPLHDFIVGERRRPLAFLLASTALLLLIACANVANLLLVRASAREQEVVVRRALGAGRGRVVRQALAESGVLAVLGTSGGWLLGLWGTRTFAALQPKDLLPVTDLAPDLRVWLFAAALCSVCAVIFGAAPALWVSRRDAADALRSSTRMSSTSRRARRFVDALAMGEIALAVTLTIGAGLLLRSYQKLSDVDPGFQPDGLAHAFVVLGGERFRSDERQSQFGQTLLQRARAIPGVESVALSTVIPLTRGGYTSDFSIRGRSLDQAGREVRHRQVSDTYFSTMQVPLLAGRAFGPEDTPTSEPVTIINKALADRFFANEDPIGQYIAADLVPDSTSVWRRIVGVVGNERGPVLSTESGIELTEPLSQDPSNFFYLMVRTTGDPANLLRTLASTVSAVDPMVAPVSLTTMPRTRHEVMARERFMALLLATFATAGALLAIVGVYGVVAQVAQRREPELKIRLALGAPPTALHWLIVRHGLTLALVGVLTGSVAAALGSAAIRTMLFQTSRLDPWVYALVAALVLLCASAASWLPARSILQRTTLTDRGIGRSRANPQHAR